MLVFSKMGPFCLDNLEWDWWKVKTFYLAFEVISTIEGYLISAAMTLIEVLCWKAKCRAHFCRKAFDLPIVH